MLRHSALACLAFFAAIADARAQQPLAPDNLETGLLASFTGARFGGAIDIDGDRAIVSASVTFLGTSLSGSAWIYEWNGLQWRQSAFLDAPGMSAYQDFGTSVEISGDVAIVGSRYMDTAAGNNSGGAVVYEFDGADWVQVAELIPPAGSDGSFYGHGLALENGIAVINGDQTAWPYLVYERQPDGSWPLVQEIKINPASPSPFLSNDLSFVSPRIDGETLYLPWPYFNSGVIFGGQIQVWERSGAQWSFDQMITTETPIEYTYLGRRFDVDGDTLVAVSPFVEQPTGPNGVAITFERIDGVWTQVDLLSDSAANSGSWGQAVAISENRMLIPQALSSFPDYPAPTVYVYERAGDSWQRIAIFEDPAGPPPPYKPGMDDWGTSYGEVLALDGDLAIVGAYVDDQLFSDAGEAYGYDVGRLTPDSLSVSLSQGGSLALTLQAGEPYAGDLYLMLGSLSGTSPGVVAGGVELPLVIDPYFNFLLSNPGTAPMLGGFGSLDAAGQATADLVVPAGTSAALAGLTANHAYVMFDPATFAVTGVSEAEAFDLLP